MNKQELLKTLEEWKKYRNSQNHELQYYQLAEVINLVEQLDEPQKVKVPAFVAEYIEAHRKWGPEIFIGDWLADNAAVDKWLYNNSEKENNRRFLIAVKAFVEGYEVEEEQKFEVIFPNLTGEKDLYLMKFYEKLSITSDRNFYVDQRYIFTEKEIKAIDERYWPFAVAVEKV